MGSLSKVEPWLVAWNSLRFCTASIGVEEGLEGLEGLMQSAFPLDHPFDSGAETGPSLRISIVAKVKRCEVEGSDSILSIKFFVCHFQIPDKRLKVEIICRAI
jgi:hypothetical protein